MSRIPHFGPRHRRRPIGHLLMPNQLTTLLIPAHMAIAALPSGFFDDHHWHDIAVLCDVIQLIAHEQGQDDVLKLAQGCNEVLLEIRARHERLGRWGANGDQLSRLQAAINPLDAFLRRQQTHRVAAALHRLRAALDQAGPDAPIVLDAAAVTALPGGPTT